MAMMTASGNKPHTPGTKKRQSRCSCHRWESRAHPLHATEHKNVKNSQHLSSALTQPARWCCSTWSLFQSPSRVRRRATWSCGATTARPTGSGGATRLPWLASCAASADTCRPNSTCPNSCSSTRRTVLRGWSTWASRSSSSTTSHSTAQAHSRVETREVDELSFMQVSRPAPTAGPGWKCMFLSRDRTWNAPRERRCSHWSSCTESGRRVRGPLALRVAVSSATRATRRWDRRRTKSPRCVQWVCAWLSSAARASALALLRAGSVGLVPRGGHHCHHWPVCLHVCNACTTGMYCTYTNKCL